MNMAGYAPYALTVAAISVVVTLISALATQRFVPYLHQPTRARPTIAEMLREIMVAAGNRNFLALALSGLIFGIAIGITGGLMLYFLTDFWACRRRPCCNWAYGAYPARWWASSSRPIGPSGWARSAAA